MVALKLRIKVGIDVSKYWFHVFLLVNGCPMPRRFDNDSEGIASFIEFLRSLGSSRIHVCMEHTGGCELALATAVFEAGFRVSLVDGALIKAYRSSCGKAKAKTDAKDAELLAQYCKERKPALWMPVPDHFRELTELVRLQEAFIADRTAWRCRASMPVASEFVEATRRAHIEVLTLQLQEVEKAIKAHIKAHPDLQTAVELLDGIEGVAFKSAVKILAEMGPVANYSCARDLALAAGLAPINADSGKKKSTRLIVYGNPSLRKALFMCALVAMRKQTGLGAFAKRLSQTGHKRKMVIVTATMRKLAHVIYGVLASGMPYSADVLTRQMRLAP